MEARLRTAVVGVCFAALLVAAPCAQAAFPGQNGKLVYTVLKCTGTCVQNLYLINPDGTGRSPLTTTAARDVAPAWSADGTRIAFASNRDDPNRATCGGFCNYEIYVMNGDGTDPRRLTFDAGVDSNPAWSPDGTKIAFDSNRGGSRGVYVMNAGGTGQTMVADNALLPAWSPDGTKIAFSAGEIWVMNADGTDKRMVTAGGSELPVCEFPEDDFYFDFAPNWSPSGDRLTYETYILASCNDGDSAYAIRTIGADGSGIRQIWYRGEGCFSGPPVWSPDGARIAFTYCSLTQMNPDGSSLTAIDSTCCGIGEADWQPIVNRPPVCSSVAVAPAVLWPPNRHFRVVELAGASDPEGDSVTIEITGVTQDEPVLGGRDAFVTVDNLVRVRAERDPHGDGRAYRVAFRATDGRGGECSGTATVRVPRQRNRPAVDSAPPSYDSLVP